MKYFITVLTIFLLFGLEAQIVPDKAIIWRGFDHRWTYNHRINVLSDFVSFHDWDVCKTCKKSPSPRSVHASASGTGKDSTYYTSYYTLISSDSIFEEYKITFPLRGNFDELIPSKYEFDMPVNSWMRNKSSYVTILNGFEMGAVRKPDKIQMFKLSVEGGHYDSGDDQIHFTLKGGLVLNCYSGECVGATDVDYQIIVYVLVIGIDSNRVYASEKYCPKTYNWDIYNELPPDTGIVTVPYDEHYKMANSTVGIKGISISLKSGIHMLEWHNFVGSLDTTKMTVKTNFQYKQWKHGMHWAPAGRWPSLFCYREEGYASIDMDLVTLQFKEAKIVYSDTSRSMYWPAGRQKPYSPDILKDSATGRTIKYIKSYNNMARQVSLIPTELLDKLK